MEYGVFLAKGVTFLVLVMLLVGFIAGLRRQDNGEKGKLEVMRLNDKYQAMGDLMRSMRLHDKKAIKADKAARKKEKKEQKKEEKTAAAEKKPAIWVLEFHGDMQAKAVSRLREEISAVLLAANEGDEVLLRLESGGGVMHGYGFASSQLDRIRDAGIPLTISVDKVAASGGYMMACVADRIICAPFATIGSIGVVAQLPNFNRLLKKNDIDLELHTAGDYKRTLTLFGENTDEGREKFVKDLKDAHELFKGFIERHRPSVDINKVATGEIWFGEQAIEAGLVDELGTSDAYITQRLKSHDLFEVRFTPKKSLSEKLGKAAESAGQGLGDSLMERLESGRYPG